MSTSDTAPRLNRLARILIAMKQPPRWAVALVVAEGPEGYLFLPCIDNEHKHPVHWWCRPYNRRNPLHWPYMALTLVTGWVVMVDV